MNITNPVGARLGIAGTFEFRDKDGNVLRTMEVRGSVPLEEAGLTVEQAVELINSQKEAHHGPDNRE